MAENTLATSSQQHGVHMYVEAEENIGCLFQLCSTSCFDTGSHLTLDLELTNWLGFTPHLGLQMIAIILHFPMDTWDLDSAPSFLPSKHFIYRAIFLAPYKTKRILSGIFFASDRTWGKGNNYVLFFSFPHNSEVNSTHLEACGQVKIHVSVLQMLL